MTPSPLFQNWRATQAVKFHSKPRATVVIRPMSQRAYAAALAARTLNVSR